MLQYLKKEANQTVTENGALTYKSTQSHCLDLFSTMGALRSASIVEIENRFLNAYCENSDLAMKLLFYGRDVRGGLGERRIFRILLNFLAKQEPETVIKNIQYIGEFGRYDDLLILFDTPCEDAMLDLIKRLLNKDLAEAKKHSKNISLLAKWLPSVNASNAETVKMGKKLAKALHMNQCQYRKMLSFLRKEIIIIENYLRECDYTFEYSIQPSKAMYKYRKAFVRNDNDRYLQFLNRVKSGESKINTGTLYPYDIVAPLIGKTPGKEERIAADVTWNALKDYTNNSNALVVIDGSGSMYNNSKPSPASIALSLGIYYGERTQGAFRNHFITFSQKPILVEIKGKDIYEKLLYCMKYNEIADTNIEKVFDLILRTAVKNHLSQQDLPETIYIISDMEFNYCVKGASATNFEYAKISFQKEGYQLPNIVFWNVASRVLQQPVTMNEQGVALVSGCTPKIFEMVLHNELSPYDYMIQILEAERYKDIRA